MQQANKLVAADVTGYDVNENSESELTGGLTAVIIT